jgi:hypothetical protein
MVLSIPVAISKRLEKRYRNGDKNKIPVKAEKGLMGETCTKCVKIISFEESRMPWRYYVFSKCG